MIGPKKKAVRRSRKNGRRGRYRCPACGRTEASLNKLIEHKRQLGHR
jgi:transposase-like protein